MYVYLYQTDKLIYPDLDNAKDGSEHTECGYFSKNELPINENDQLYKIIQKIL